MSLTQTEINRLINLQKIVESMREDVAEHFNCFEEPLPLNILSIKYSKRLIANDDSFQNTIKMLINDGTFDVLRSASAARFLLPKNSSWQKEGFKLASTTKKGTHNERAKFTKTKESGKGNKGSTGTRDTRPATGQRVSCGFRKING